MKKVFVLVLTALFALPAFAAKPVTFIATEDVSYDDNIYLKNGGNDKKDSFISTTRVGANYKGQLPGSDLKLTAGALAGYNAYTEKPSTNNYWDALGSVELANEQFKLGDRLLYTSDPANNALTDRAKRMNNDAYVSFKTTNKKMFSVGLSVEDIFDRYFESNWSYLNRNRFNAGVQGFYNFNTKTNVFVEYMFSDIVYQDNGASNSTGHTVGLGVNGQIAPKVTGTAKVTYAMRDYSRNVTGAENHPDLFGYYAALTWKATSKDTITLSGERKMEETLYDINRYFTDTLIAVKGQHKFNSKWAASLLLGWEDMDYARAITGPKRHDTLFTVRPSVDYMFKDWLMAGVWYQYRTRDSNIHWADYDNNKAGITVKALF
jgi:hypothetical protein